MFKRIAASILALSLALGGVMVPAEMHSQSGAVVSVYAAETYGDFTYTVLSDNTVEISAYNGSDEEVIIPGEIEGMSVTSIGAKAFYSYQTMTKITLPESLKSIGTYAFYSCKNLTSIDIPDSVNFIDISAFQDCDGLTSVKLPSGIDSISDRTFNSCDALESVEIPQGVKSIGQNAFALCKALDNVVIPDGVTYLADNVFSYCSGLNSISIPDSIEYAGRNVFNGTPWIENQSGLVYVGKVAYKYAGEMPENTSVTLRADTTCIATEAFKDCSLSEISMPDTVTIIDKGAFYKTNLTEIKLSTSLTKLGDNVFYGCTSLEKLEIPDTVTSIGDSVCSGCTSLESAFLPNGITELSTKMFSDCANLKSVNIPESVTAINGNAFNKCTSLENIELHDGITYIGAYAFRGCAFKSMTVPAGMTSLSANTFYECTNLKQVVIQDGLTTINTKAFNDCSELETIEIPDSVKTINTNAFYKCPNLTLICSSDSFAATYAENNNIPYSSKTTGGVIDENCVSISVIDTYEYTGSEIKPEVDVCSNGLVLTEDIDYTVTYSDNVNVGTAKVIVSGIGNYSGNVEKTFEITAKDIESTDISLSSDSFEYTGKSIKPKVTVSNGSDVLTLNTDYVIRYSDNIEIGTASVIIAGRGNYSGRVTKTFEITESAYTDLSDCDITLSKTVYKSSGSACKPKVTVKNGSAVLTLGTDYLVRYADNIEPGTASVIIAGRGKYTGRIIKTFTILDSNAKQISDCTITLSKTNFAYTGNTCKPKVTVSDGDTVLTRGTDYNVRYVNNIEVGTATVVISGTGKYQGLVEKSFIIE